MHPARSVIFFTTASGAGYGLFFWLGLFFWMDLAPETTAFMVTALAASFGLIMIGLLSSTLHLGHPERAWRALSQWRSSWLSREGVMAILTFIPMGIFAIGSVFRPEYWWVAPFGLIGGVMSILTVFTTAMIYASLKSIPAWYNGWTKVGYLVLALMSGAVLFLVMASILGEQSAKPLIVPVAILLVTGLLVKIAYWHHIDDAAPISTAETATGLGRFGKTSLIASPHDSDNYLLKEMGFKIARKHAAKLRKITVLMGFILPLALIVAAGFLSDNLLQFLMFTLAAIFCATGLACERWLFFAEAKHVVTLYYGETSI